MDKHHVIQLLCVGIGRFSETESRTSVGKGQGQERKPLPHKYSLCLEGEEFWTWLLMMRIFNVTSLYA